MSVYCTPADMAIRPGARECAEACTRTSLQVCKTPIMDALMRGNSTAGFPAPDVAIGVLALATLQANLDAAERKVNVALQMAAYVLPLALPAPELLMDITRAIARYYNHPDLRRVSPNHNDGQHPIHSDYDEALKLLDLIAKRQLSLGINDPAPPVNTTNSGPAFFSGEPRLWARSARAL